MQRCIPMAALFVLPLAGVRGEESRVLWALGVADDDTREFALAPNGYGSFDKDPVFLVGHSDPRKDWPYALPGPDDSWAGGSTHTFKIVFALASWDPAGECSLVVDFVDTHGIRPPTLRISVNGKSYTQETPRGAGDASISGDSKSGREHRCVVAFPGELLRSGINEISIATPSGSWALFDWVGLEVPTASRADLGSGTRLLSARAEPWLVPRGDTLAQPVTVSLVHLGETETASIRTPDTAPVVVTLESGYRDVIVYLPPVERSATTQLTVRRDDKVIATATVSRVPAKLRAPVDYVDPMLGTSTSRWMLYPGPSMPFSMVKLSPDNQRHSWKAGYEYTIENIAGFSHIHSWTMGGLLTMPTTGELRIVPGTEGDPDAGYRSRFRHEEEVARVGYYGVTLDDYGIRAELTSTTRAGFQRYTFPESETSWILFDLLTPTEYNYDVLEAKVRKVSNTEIEGYSKQRGGPWARWNDYTVHFVARASKPFQELGGWVGEEVRRDITEISGEGDVGAFLRYRTKAGEVIQLQTGISLVSVEQARLNLETELSPFRWDFDAVRSHARKIWSDLLGLIEVEGGTETDKVKLYTNLYRSYCSRTIWSDVNGKYVDMYEKVQQMPDPDSPIYGCDAFWNTFWNLNQLWNLITPDVSSKWVRSLLEISDRGGWLPKGPTGIEYSSIMVASHEIALIVAAYQHGIRNFDVEKAYEAIRFIQTTQGRPHEGGGQVGNQQLDPYRKLGYVPVEAGPVSNTLEYAYDDGCVAQMAKALGKESDYRLFLDRSKSYKNVFDPSVGYSRQRHADGRWVKDFSPFSGAGFVEGNAWQFTWFAPHDVQGLIELLGKEEFNRRLDKGLQDSVASNFNATNDRFADYPINHGNQPNMQSAWLFNHSGKPWLTQKWTREILDRYYGTGPIDGYPGDEDQGQMGAWFVLGALGLFQMDGGCSVKPIYEISGPLFERITIRLDDKYYPGGKFVIEAPNTSRQNRYVQSASLDGKPLEKPWLYQSELVDGGVLRLEMGPEPNEAWGSAPSAAPPQGARDP